MPKDNATFALKARLRLDLLAGLDAPPVVLETHGGRGELFRRVYAEIARGVVMERDEKRAELLAAQRPTWAVYQCRAEDALAEGIGGHLEVNLLDVDPYGECWPVLEAWFSSDRPRAEVLYLAVNDGLRSKLRVGGAWEVKSMREMVARYGNGLHGRYLEVCRELVEQKASRQGYRLAAFDGYYCGRGRLMTHFWARLERSPTVQA